MDTHGRNYNLKCHTAAIVTFLCLHSQFEKFIYQVYEFEITTANTCFFVFFYWCYFHNSGINREYKFEYLVHDYINMLTFVFKLHGITLVICTQ